MARISIDDRAIARIKGYSEHYGTDDLNMLLFALATERDALRLCVAGSAAAPQQAAPVAPLAAADDGALPADEIAELEGLLS